MQPEPDLVYRVFSAICETRTLTKAGYAKFRNFLLYGEQGLAGKKALINIFQNVPTLEQRAPPLPPSAVQCPPPPTPLSPPPHPPLSPPPPHPPHLPPLDF